MAETPRRRRRGTCELGIPRLATGPTMVAGGHDIPLCALRWSGLHKIRHPHHSSCFLPQENICTGPHTILILTSPPSPPKGPCTQRHLLASRGSRQEQGAFTTGRQGPGPPVPRATPLPPIPYSRSSGLAGEWLAAEREAGRPRQRGNSRRRGARECGIVIHGNYSPP